MVGGGKNFEKKYYFRFKTVGGGQNFEKVDVFALKWGGGQLKTWNGIFAVKKSKNMLLWFPYHFEREFNLKNTRTGKTEPF